MRQGWWQLSFMSWDKVDDKLELSIKSCAFGPELYPSFDASYPPGCCLQSHELLLNKGMKYWDSGSNARSNAGSSRTFTTTVHIAATVIGWRLLGKERTGQTQFSTKFGKLSFIRLEAQCTFFFLFFEISSPIWPNRGFQCRLFLTLRINLFSLRRWDKLLTQSFSF
jgi:hypothetical protein